ncbi:MAG: hypothetical protein KAW92_08895 [Candidatus Cloacimonetes bacterium]|nr:hypothetical protein [Candidatus Cloacimonadota bacterium]
MNKCPICGSPTYRNITGSIGRMTVDEVDCYRCGRYIIDRSGSMELDYLRNSNQFNNITMSKISGWIRENQDLGIVEINRKKLQSLISLPELTVFEKADKMLLHLAKQFPIAGSYLTYKFNEIFGILERIKKKTFPEEGLGNSKEFYKNITDLLPLISIGRIIDGYEFEFIWKQYIIAKNEYISQYNSIPMITPTGWAYLETFRHPNPESKKAFVAMWFTDEMKEILEKYIQPAAFDAGEYKAETIDEKDFNGDVNDAIIGEIRNSKFVIADFTGNRGGVYYEAGFAKGFNIPVIFTCNEEWWDKEVERKVKAKLNNGEIESVKITEKRKVHFDLNHQSFILWKDGKDLYDKLVKRIKSLPLT